MIVKHKGLKLFKGVTLEMEYSPKLNPLDDYIIRNEILRRAIDGETHRSIAKSYGMTRLQVTQFCLENGLKKYKKPEKKSVSKFKQCIYCGAWFEGGTGRRGLGYCELHMKVHKVYIQDGITYTTK